MDLNALLNTTGPTESPTHPRKPSRPSISTPITDGGRTLPSTALPTPSPERTLSAAVEQGHHLESKTLWKPFTPKDSTGDVVPQTTKLSAENR